MFFLKRQVFLILLHLLQKSQIVDVLAQNAFFTNYSSNVYSPVNFDQKCNFA